MATYFVDCENGNDASDGTSFATRWKTLTSGATVARIAPGDEIRIMGSPAPTSLGQNGVWTSQAYQGTKNILNATNTTPITITVSSHDYNTGDTVLIAYVNGNTAANGVWEITVIDSQTFTLDGSSGNANYTSSGQVRLRNNARVMLSTPVTQNIASTGYRTTAWTSADANVTTQLRSDLGLKEGSQVDRIYIGPNFTTGLAAYWPTGTLDLSAYQQVSFWIYNETGQNSQAGSLSLALCSDTGGQIVVNTVDIPARNINSRWMPFTVDLGSNLGSSIQSIALYVNTDLSTQGIYLNNIIACKASSASDSLTLTSLIGKNTTGELFWGIQSINGTRVMLDGGDTNSTPNYASVRGYYGATETVTTWKRETIKLGPFPSKYSYGHTINDSGTANSPITFSGGWNRTDMSTQTLETILDGVNSSGYLINASNKNFITISKIGFVRGYVGLNFTGSRGVGCNFEDIFCTNMDYGLLSANVCAASKATIKGVAACSATLTLPASFGRITLDGPVVSNAASGVTVYNGDLFVECTTNSIIANNSGYGFLVSGPGAVISGAKTADNTSGSIVTFSAGTAYFINHQSSDITLVQYGGTGSGYGLTQTIQLQDIDAISDNHAIYMNGGRIITATDQRKTASGISWKMQPTSSDRNSINPIGLPLAKVACAANSLVTVKAWMRRDNSNLNMRLACRGGQIAGVANDVTSSISTTNDWEELTITFTPTKVGVVEITAEAWGGTTYSGWVDDLTISQP